MTTIDQLERGNGTTGTAGAIAKAADRIGCEYNYLKAILQAESGGAPYDDKGRLIILPEKHIFWRYLPKDLRNKARTKGLATPKWSRANYAGLGGSGSDKRWARLRAMVGLHEEAGLKSASYGKPQIMGFNHKLCGFPSVAEFVLALAQSEDSQDDAFIRYLEGVGLAQALRDRDSRAVARRYNGPGQVNHYAGIIDRHYANILANEGAPEGKRGTKGDARSKMLRLGSEGYRVRALQEKLVELGYHVSVDGDFGPATRRAVVAFQVDHGLVTDGIVGSQTEEALEVAIPVRNQPGGTREKMTVADLRKRGSQTVKQADKLTIGGIVAMLFGSTGELANVEDDGWLGYITKLASQARTQVEPVFTFANDHRALALVLAGIAVFLIARRIKLRRLHDAKSWRHVG